MLRSWSRIASSLLFVFAVVANAHAQENVSLVLGNATVIDGTGAPPIESAWIRIENGIIEEVSSAAIEPEPGTRVIDLEGRYLLPGLIDAHVHVSRLDQARRALASGVTTARSAGVEHFTDVGLRKVGSSGAVVIPEILPAGYHVRPRLAEALILDTPELTRFLAEPPSGASDFRQITQVMIDRDVDHIKTNATARAGLPTTDPREPIMTSEELRTVVQVAETAGVPVMTHAHGDVGAQRAVEAGVRSIEHGTYLSEQTLQIMTDRETYLVPTIAVVTDLAEPGGSYDDAFLQIRGRHMLATVRKTAARAYRMGVPVVAATDTGYGPESVVRLGHELEEFVGIGMTPMEAIQAATSRAAELLGVADHTGRVAEGLDADLLVVSRDPIKDITNVQDVLMVVANGHVAVNRLEW